MQEGEIYRREFVADEQVYNGFISTFGDRNILHTDEIYAQSKGFRGRVVHGNVLAGFLSYFIGECLPLSNVIIHRQEMAFPKPVYIGDYLILEAVVESYSEAVKACSFKFKFINGAAERVCYGKIQIGLI